MNVKTDKKPLDETEVQELSDKLYYIGYRVAKGGQESMDLEAMARYVLMNVYMQERATTKPDEQCKYGCINGIIEIKHGTLGTETHDCPICRPAEAAKECEHCECDTPKINHNDTKRIIGSLCENCGKNITVKTFKPILKCDCCGCNLSDFRLCPNCRPSTHESEVEEILIVLQRLVERIDHNGGLGEYKGGPSFVMKYARDILIKYGKLK